MRIFPGSRCMLLSLIVSRIRFCLTDLSSILITRDLLTRFTEHDERSLLILLSTTGWFHKSYSMKKIFPDTLKNYPLSNTPMLRKPRGAWCTRNSKNFSPHMLVKNSTRCFPCWSNTVDTRRITSRRSETFLRFYIEQLDLDSDP